MGVFISNELKKARSERDNKEDSWWRKGDWPQLHLQTLANLPASQFQLKERPRLYLPRRN